MNIVVFEDSNTTQLYPITTGKPSYSITCASFRLIDWLAEMRGELVGLVRPYLETLQLHDYPEFSQWLNPRFQTTWLINARLVPSVTNFRLLHQFKDQNSSCQHRIAKQGWSITTALVPTNDLIDLSRDECRRHISNLVDAPQSNSEVSETELVLYEYPHDVIDQNIKCFRENLAYRLSMGRFQEREPGVFLGEQAAVHDSVVFDTKSGPILIDHHVNIGPFSLIRGPVYIGPHSKVCEHAAIKDEVSISHTCKIGGEVEASVIEAFSNKQHHGFLGHSYLGSWINLGAGTCNSDLKNTYGLVNMRYGDRKVTSGMQFVGCIMGDYVKTAINTGIFTGKVIGAGSMVYGFATTNVPSFVNYARSFGEISNLPPEVIVATQARMFARRKVTQRPCDIQLVHDMYRLTESERPVPLSSAPLSL